MMKYNCTFLPLLLLFVLVSIGTNSKIVTASSPQDLSDFEEIIPEKIRNKNNNVDGIDGNLHERLLQFCFNYEYVAYIRDDLTMSYFVTNNRISIELLYEGEAWIALGTNPNGSGKSIGAEAWVALPDASDTPAIYNINGYAQTNVDIGSSQTLDNGSIVQQNGQTIMRFEKLLNDDPNVSINGQGEEVFLWAIGTDNGFGLHRRRGAFRIKLEPCLVPSLQKEEVEITVECGLFGLSLFCPFSFCGIFGSLLGLCNAV
jgi:hypothetical protein